MPPTNTQQILEQITKLIPILQDLMRQIQRAIGVSNQVVERYARTFEELDSIRLSLEELREISTEQSQALVIWIDKVNEQIKELRQLAVLERTGANPREALTIKQRISDDLMNDQLVQEIASNQRELMYYQTALNQVNEQIARRGGEPTPLQYNSKREYEIKIDQLKVEIQIKQDSTKPYGTEAK